MCLLFKNCQMHGGMLSVVLKNFSMEFWLFWKSKIISSQSSSFIFLQFFGYYWYICLWLLCVGCSTFPPLTSKLYWLYSVTLVSILSSYLPHLHFSSPFFVYYCSLISIFANLSFVFAVYVVSSLFTSSSRWHVCSELL